MSPRLFNFYAEYIMQNAGRREAQAGLKIVKRNINNLRYEDDTTLMAESEEALKSLLMTVRAEWKSWLEIQHYKNEGHALWSHHFMAIRETMETVTDFLFLDFKITVDGDCSHEIKKTLALWKKSYDKP